MNAAAVAPGFRGRWSSHRSAWWLGEYGLLVIVAAVVDLQIHNAADPHTPHPGLAAYAFGVFFAALLPARRRWPIGVLLASVVLLAVYNLIGFPGFSPVIPLAVPLYAAASSGRLLWATGSAVVATVLALTFSLGKDHPSVATALNRRVLEACLLAALIVLGEAVRGRRALGQRMREEARRANLDAEREFQRRLAEERLRIARELHDVLAHTLTGAAIQASVAADTLADDPSTSRAAIDAVRSSYAEARAELAATVGLLRAGASDPRSDPERNAVGLGQLEPLLNAARQAGLNVELHVEGQDEPLSPATDLTTYRIIQESLTNVIRHAHAQTVRISLIRRRQELILSITDDGRSSPHTPTTHGFGLIGMQERATAIGGQLTARANDDGFRVTAILPTTRIGPRR